MSDKRVSSVSRTGTTAPKRNLRDDMLRQEKSTKESEGEPTNVLKKLSLIKKCGLSGGDQDVRWGDCFNIH